MHNYFAVVQPFCDVDANFKSSSAFRTEDINWYGEYPLLQYDTPILNFSSSLTVFPNRTLTVFLIVLLITPQIILPILIVFLIVLLMIYLIIYLAILFTRKHLR